MALPRRHPSVYVIYGEDRIVLYVGASKDPLARIGCHEGQRDWWPDVVSVEVEHFNELDEARAREKELIRSLNPRHNIMSRTDLPKRPKATPIPYVPYVDLWDSFPGQKDFAFRLWMESMFRQLNDETMAETLGVTVKEWMVLRSQDCPTGGIPLRIIIAAARIFPALQDAASQISLAWTVS